MLKKLELLNFRNYQDWGNEFSNELCMLVGPNGVGKTNILEAIYLLSTGSSFRATKISQMITWDAEVAHVIGKINESNSSNDLTELRITLTHGQIQGKKTPKRRFLLNGVPRQKRVFTGHLPSVIFLPQDLNLVTGSPSRRRRFLDDILTQTDPEYTRSLTSYEKGIRRRNKILFLIREGQNHPRSLTFWNKLIIKEGQYLTKCRRVLIDHISSQASLFGKSTTSLSQLVIKYHSSTISEARLDQYSNREIASGHTLIGPHKDDFSVLGQLYPTSNTSKDLSLYGSRGQQRMAVLWLKLNQLSYMTSQLKTRPILLLDDIFSELDDTHAAEVRSWCSKQQTIITTTDITDTRQLPNPQIIKLTARNNSETTPIQT